MTERPSHGAPTWFVRDKKVFVTFWEHGHHAEDFPHLWCAAPPGAQEELLLAAPDRVFRPPYVGHRGWLGVGWTARSTGPRSPSGARTRTAWSRPGRWWPASTADWCSCDGHVMVRPGSSTISTVRRHENEPASYDARGYGRGTGHGRGAAGGGVGPRRPGPAGAVRPAAGAVVRARRASPPGSLLGTAPSNGVTPPFADQPIQGFSGIVRNSDGTFEVLSDNGYGNKANSADFVLRIQRIAPDFAAGAVDVVGGINLTDPGGHVPFPLTRPDRVLTGADFDVESIVRVPDGSYWIGDEFGPYLLHVDRAGRVLQAPVATPGVFAPESPDRGSTPANLASSKGFEGMARSPDGRTLYPLLEGTVAGDPAGTLRLYEFSLAAGAYTGRRWTYQLADPAYAIGDATMVDEHRMLVIERDNNQGDAAAFKQIFLVDLRDRDRDGRVDKTLVADLLNIANPHAGRRLRRGLPLPVHHDRGRRDPRRPDDRCPQRQQLPVLLGPHARATRTTTSSSCCASTERLGVDRRIA